MYYKQFKKIALFLFMVGAIGTASAQAVLKVGDNLYTISSNAALEVESTTKGFLPPRMTRVQRDAIVSPPTGLQVWCTDSNVATTPASGELCVYVGTGWVPFTLSGAPRLSTNLPSDATPSLMVSATSATIKGTLITSFGSKPTETGIVWREIMANDFGTLPILSAIGTASVPTYNTVGTLVTADNSTMSVTIPTLTSTTGSTRPYYFRTYAKSPLGIGYGNAILLNGAPPAISTPVVTNGTSLNPSFAGTLTVNAGTPQGTITEYGYCTSATNPPTTGTNKVVLSTAAALTALNASLTGPTFTADPTISLPVGASSYFPPVANGSDPTYFVYYVVAKGSTYYSPVASFIPNADPITGGSAIATFVSSTVSGGALKIGVPSTANIVVTLNVTRAGTSASFAQNGINGTTAGLSLSSIPAANLALGSQTLTFPINGTPSGSTSGTSFSVTRLPNWLLTGAIADVDPTGNAICDASTLYTVIPITSSTTKVWMDRNLGASRAASASNDYMSYGCSFQWGRGNDGHASMNWTSATAGTQKNNAISGPTTTPTTPGNGFLVASGNGDWRTPSDNTLWQSVNSSGNPCPSGYRIPTALELANEVTQYAMTSLTAAFGSPLKIPGAGSRSNSTGGSTQAGTYGYYWSGDINTTNSLATFRNFTPVDSNNSTAARSFGMSVRCIQN